MILLIWALVVVGCATALTYLLTGSLINGLVVFVLATILVTIFIQKWKP